MQKPRTTLPAIVLGLSLLVSACAGDATTPAADTAAATTEEDTAMGAMGDDTATGEGALAVAGLDHAILLVTDLDAQSAFYTELLGWQQIAEGDSNRLGLVGGVGLNLVASDGQQAGTRTSGVDALGFRTTDIETAASALTDADLEFERTEFPLPDGGVNDVLSFTDPEGNAINLVQPRA